MGRLKWVDTNIILEAFIRTGTRSKRCFDFLTSEKGLVTNVLVMAEVEWVLRSVYKQKRDLIGKLMIRLIDLDNLKINNSEFLEEAVGKYMISTADLVDCIIWAEAKRMGVGGVVSYDKDYDKLGIKRIEP